MKDFANKQVSESAIFFCLIALIAATFFSCKKNTQTAKDDYQQLIERDTIRVLTLNTSTSYFIYRDQKMGYHYDMIKNFANEKGLEIEIIIAANNSELYEMLYDNKGDIIAYNIPIENDKKDFVNYCGLSEITHQVLIQKSEREDTLINDVSELIDKEVFVLKDSKYEARINNLNNELGGGIKIKHLDTDSLVVEDLIRMVSRGDIKYTLAENSVAKINQTYFRNIDISLPISFDQRTSWAVRKDSPTLADSLNAWYERAHLEESDLRFSKRYFEESKGFHIDNQASLQYIISAGQISHWDRYFKEYGEKYKLDWRLLASISFHESTFDPEVKSWAGAGGLMGIMPATARSMGVNSVDLFVPEINIELGAKYLRSLIDLLSSVEDEEERIKLALASYNGGIGHISDARDLAEKYDANKNIWDGNVEKYLELKKLEKYYKDPVCKSGYFRADETVNYVQNVMSRWYQYKTLSNKI